MRRGEKHRRQLSMPSSGKLRSPRLLPATSLLPAKSLTPAKSLSPAPHQAALPAQMFRRLRHQMLTTQASFNSPPPPPTPSLNLSKQGLQATFGECNYYFCILKCLFHLYLSFLYSKCLILFV